MVSFLLWFCASYYNKRLFGGTIWNILRCALDIFSGIGFLGAGVIFVKDDLIQGLTTAAGMWTTSGIAACIGAGLIFIGVFATLFLVVLQKIFHYPFFNQIDVAFRSEYAYNLNVPAPIG